MGDMYEYKDYCKGFKNDSLASEKKSFLMLTLRSWLISRLQQEDYEYGYTSLDDLTVSSKKFEYKDALSRIADDVILPIKHIIKDLHEKIIRENTLMPIYKVKEINSYGINWLSKRNGRTIKEKLSNSNSMMAVQRRSSLDTGENRLVLALAKNLVDIIQLKLNNMPKKFISKNELELQQELLLFLRDDSLKEIRRWENLPPNNALISDKFYSKAWRAWTELQKLDDLVNFDEKFLYDHFATMVFWEFLHESRKVFSYIQVPVVIDFTKFVIDIVGTSEEDNGKAYGMDNDGELLSISKKRNSFSSSIIIKYRKKYIEIRLDKDNIDFLLNDYLISSYKLYEIDVEAILKEIDFIMPNISIDNKQAVDKLLEPEYGKCAAIDIFSAVPNFLLDDKPLKNFPYRIMRQQYLNGKYDISNAYSSAVLVNGDTIPYTINSVFKESKGRRITRLLRSINAYLRVDQIHFIYPDIYGDFELQEFRKNIPLCYRSVEDLPKSVASIFAYMTQDEFKDDFDPDDVVIVVDYVNSKCSLTILESEYDKGLEETIPETKGIIWEKYPAKVVPISSKESKFTDGLKNFGWNNLEFFKEQYGVDGLATESNKLILCENNNICLPINEEIIGLEESDSFDITGYIDSFVDENMRIIGKKRIKIISLSRKLFSTNKHELFYMGEENILQGVFINKEWQNIYTEDFLWHIHLPNMAIKRLVGTFNLVKDRKIIPRKGNVIEIPIDAKMTLSKNKNKYHFHLVQDDGKGELQYEAVVEHSSFPLKEDVECTLEMTYTYGAEEPYSLIFIPIDTRKAGFKEAKVNWTLISEYDSENLPYPQFPVISDWDKLHNWPNKNNLGTKDLFVWLEQYFGKEIRNTKIEFDNIKSITTCDIYNQGVAFIIECTYNGYYSMFSILEKRLPKGCDEISSLKNYFYDFHERNSDKFKRYSTYGEEVNWFLNKQGKYMAVVQINGLDVFFYKENFLIKSHSNSLPTEMTFEISINKRGTAIAKRIVQGLQEVKLYEVDAVYESELNEKALANTSILYPLNIIFSDKRNIFMEEFPNQLRAILVNVNPILIDMLLKTKNSDIIWNLTNILSLLVNERLNEFYPKANTIVENSSKDLPEGIGYALGDCTTVEQKELLDKILKIKDKEKIIEIFSKAVWKNKDFIFNVPSETIMKIFRRAIHILLYKQINYKPKQFLKIVEFVIAVFRLREKNDVAINKKLSLNNSQLKKLNYLVEEKIQGKVKLPSSRLVFEFKGDKVYNNVPMILYALLVYITGDTGDGDIIIADIKED